MIFCRGICNVQCTNYVLKWQLVQLVHLHVSKLVHLCKQLDKIRALVTLKDVAKLVMVGDHV